MSEQCHCERCTGIRTDAYYTEEDTMVELDKIQIERAWAMPSSNTFSIKPIKVFVDEALEISGWICDPFVRNSPFKVQCVSNDIDPDICADFHMDALDFLKTRKDDEFDGLLFDPPYSPRQVSECYKKIGKTVNMQTTQASFWSNLKKEIGRVVMKGGVVVTCGWNSGGVGKKYGFQIDKVLLVAHGGWHNDTIITREMRL